LGACHSGAGITEPPTSRQTGAYALRGMPNDVVAVAGGSGAGISPSVIIIVVVFFLLSLLDAFDARQATRQKGFP